MSLRDELEAVALDLGHVIQETKARALGQGVDPFRTVDTTGAPLLGPLLAARAQALAALATLS